MNNVDLLILQGPPGSGKSSIASAIAELLRKNNTRYAVIELDDLAKIHPLSLRNIMYKNLSRVWPNYVELGNIKIIIPTYLQIGEFEIVKEATPANRTTVFEITAPLDEISQRIVNREPNKIMRKRLLNYLDNYLMNRAEDKFIDFKVFNHNKTVEKSAAEIIKKLGW